MRNLVAPGLDEDGHLRTFYFRVVFTKAARCPRLQSASDTRPNTSANEILNDAGMLFRLSLRNKTERNALPSHDFAGYC